MDSGRPLASGPAAAWWEAAMAAAAAAAAAAGPAAAAAPPVRVRLSCVQIYNDAAYGLLDSDRPRGLPVEQWTPLAVVHGGGGGSGGGGGGGRGGHGGRGGFVLPELRVYDVASEADALTLLLLAHVARTTAATPMNLASSRSHCVFTLDVDTAAA